MSMRIAVTGRKKAGRRADEVYPAQTFLGAFSPSTQRLLGAVTGPITDFDFSKVKCDSAKVEFLNAIYYPPTGNYTGFNPDGSTFSFPVSPGNEFLRGRCVLVCKAIAVITQEFVTYTVEAGAYKDNGVPCPEKTVVIYYK